MTSYQALPDLLDIIPGPQGDSCRRILADHGERFQQAPGSTHNHQVWTGGYADHVNEVMNLCVQLHEVLASTRRLTLLPPEEHFTLSDALVVLFVHDLEKPWRHVFADGEPAREADGAYRLDPDLRHKADRTAFVARMIANYDLHLTPTQQNALRYVEGIRDHDYSPGSRVMQPLGALVHACDLWSARLFYDFPLASGDPWSGARRAAH